jgi:hypothetical protein
VRPSLVLLAALLALASVAQAAPDSGRLRLDFSDVDRAGYSSTQRWEGARAQEEARTLDARFGNGDGMLAPAEAEAAARAMERDLQGSRFDEVKLDGVSAVVGRADAEYAGDGAALELRLRLDLLLTPGPGGHALEIAPAWETHVVLMPPEGWRFNTLDGQDATVTRAGPGEPARAYLLPAGVDTITLHAPRGAFVDVRTLVMAASAAGLLGIVVFAGRRRRATG